MTTSLKTTANDIKAYCSEWNKQYAVWRPKTIQERKNQAIDFKWFVRAVLSMFITPKHGTSKNIYIFKGLKNKVYMELFDKSSVVIIGSKKEKKYAKEMGYGFIWSWPVRSSVTVNVYRGGRFFILWQLKLWRAQLTKKSKVLIFLNEDTQPIGTFLSQIATVLPNKVTVVCIQHGYYVNHHCSANTPRLEGKLCEYNFVWDDKQAEIMKSAPGKTYVIGLPYFAEAQARENLPIIFVGTGESDIPEFYLRSLNIFSQIDELLNQKFSKRAVYRPHPYEFKQPEVMLELEQRFNSVDFLNKIDRLNTGKSIFIGNVSSLLYEAKLAGHYVVIFDMNKDLLTPVFDYDLKIDPSNLTGLVDWMNEVVTQIDVNYFTDFGKIATPLERFQQAIIDAKLIDENELLRQ